MKVYNSSKNNLISGNAEMANNLVTRTIGLITKKSFSSDESLVIFPCCSVHTFFMKFEIDVLFVNSKKQVVALFENVKNNRILPIILSSTYVIELPAGVISLKNIEKGDVIELQE